MITLFDAEGNIIPHSKMIFSGGEVQVRILDLTREPVKMLAHIRNSNDIMEMCLLNDAITEANFDYVDLVIPYFPYARQDRVCYPGESNSFSVMLEMMWEMPHKSIEVWDIHNPKALWSHCYARRGYTNIEAWNFVKNIQFNNIPLIVAPDKGAVTRASQCVEKINEGKSILDCTSLIIADKVRNPDNGEITGMTIDYKNLHGVDCLMVDDICDGGRTFIELAKVLKAHNAGDICLYVTHGIFSKGLQVLEDGGIKHVYTANPFTNHCRTNSGQFVTVVSKD